jgi:hypothetical protein
LSRSKTKQAQAPTAEPMEKAEKRIPATTTKKGTPVSPQKLLEITSRMEGQPSDKIAFECGYYTEVTTTATGEVEVRVTVDDNFAFTRALLAAQGINLAPPVRSNRRTNRRPIIKIGKTGNIVVGGRYTTIAGFGFGEDIDSRVRVEAEKGKITIFAASPDDYASDQSDDAEGDVNDDPDAFDESEIDDL